MSILTPVRAKKKVQETLGGKDQVSQAHGSTCLIHHHRSCPHAGVLCQRQAPAVPHQQHCILSVTGSHASPVVYTCW